MSTLRSVCLGISFVLLSACVSNSGRVGERSSATDAAIANMNLGAGYLRQGRMDLAIERLTRALAQDPKLIEAHSTIALAYDQIGSLDAAEDHYRRATQLDPTNGTAANAYAVFLCRQSRWVEAEPYFKHAADNPTYSTPEVAMTNAGVCARSAGAAEQAADHFRAALARSPTHADALLNMLELSYEGANYIQARAFAQRYLDAHPATPSVLLMCVNTERQLNNGVAADRCAARLRSEFQSSPELQQLNAQGRNVR